MKPATFSIVALDRDAGELGIAVESKFLSVGALVPWLESGVGAVATKAWANTSFGPRGLALLREGKTPDATLAGMLAADDGREHRQVGIVDGAGRAATHTGAQCIPWAGGVAGDASGPRDALRTGVCRGSPGTVDDPDLSMFAPVVRCEHARQCRVGRLPFA